MVLPEISFSSSVAALSTTKRAGSLQTCELAPESSIQMFRRDQLSELAAAKTSGIFVIECVDDCSVDGSLDAAEAPLFCLLT
jgi:hypothetical protein